MTTWVLMPPVAVQELAGFPAALLPDLPVPVVFEAGGQRIASHASDGKPGVRAPPSACLPVPSDAGCMGATGAELADVDGTVPRVMARRRDHRRPHPSPTSNAPGRYSRGARFYPSSTKGPKAHED